MRAYSQLAQNMGASGQNVFELQPGEIVEFKGGAARRAGKLTVKTVLVDGLGIGDVGNVVLRDRQILATDGVAIALIKIDRSVGKLIENPEVISRGFVYEAKQKGLLEDAAGKLRGHLEGKRLIEAKVARDAAIVFLERFFFEKTGRRPMILPVVIEV